MKPTTQKEWIEAVLEGASLFHSIPTEWRSGAEDQFVDMSGWAEVVEFSPDDLVVTVQGGMRFGALQELLAREARQIPFGASAMPIDDWTIAEILSINPPHGAEFELGSWRDWVLGGTLLLGEGKLIKVGSKAVKNVAGYDAQKLIVGSRGTLAVVLEVTLMVGPMRKLESLPILTGDQPWYVQRVSQTDGPSLMSSAPPEHVFHEPTATLWARTDAELPRFPGDWVMRPGKIAPSSALEGKLWRRAKELIDPRGVLNPGYLETSHG